MVKGIQCVGHVRKGQGRQCKKHTRRGQKCWQHYLYPANQQVHPSLRIKTSNIPHAGLGLFAGKKDIRPYAPKRDKNKHIVYKKGTSVPKNSSKPTRIDRYAGRLMKSKGSESLSHFQKKLSEYSLMLRSPPHPTAKNPALAIDAQRPTASAARFANGQKRGGPRANARFQVDSKHKKAYLVVGGTPSQHPTIKAGQEIIANYGNKQYFQDEEKKKKRPLREEKEEKEGKSDEEKKAVPPPKKKHKRRRIELASEDEGEAGGYHGFGGLGGVDAGGIRDSDPYRDYEGPGGGGLGGLDPLIDGGGPPPPAVRPIRPVYGPHTEDIPLDAPYSRRLRRERYGPTEDTDDSDHLPLSHPFWRGGRKSMNYASKFRRTRRKRGQVRIGRKLTRSILGDYTRKRKRSPKRRRPPSPDSE